MNTVDTYLGIELGSTRIKASMIDHGLAPISEGSYLWKSENVDGFWSYDLSQALEGINEALRSIDNLETVAAVGLSGMMHGYLAFDKDWQLLVPFRTWQNTTTKTAANELSTVLGFHIPQRWSIAHLYQAILNGESHLSQIAHITTLAGYFHYRLTGVNTVGIGEASGIFPVDSQTKDYDEVMLSKFEALAQAYGFTVSLRSLLPTVSIAGERAGYLSKEGAALLEHRLPEGLPFAPPEGDAATGMVATNAISPRTGNISAGTSLFAMVVLERHLSSAYEEIDIVATPIGQPVAMIHCNNGTSDMNAWVSMFRELLTLFGLSIKDDKLYDKLFQVSLSAENDGGGIVICNYLAGEHLTHFDKGCPLVARKSDAVLSLPNFMRTTLYSAMATLSMGMELLTQQNVAVDSLTAHGGLFQTAEVAQRYLAAACRSSVTVMETAGSGGAYGMALLAAFSAIGSGQTLQSFLYDRVFAHTKLLTLSPTPSDVEGFQGYLSAYRELLKAETIAAAVLST